jgi:hypothetical protein
LTAPGKALTIRQPWAWLIIHGGKDIENRGWNTNVRGPVLIHAAKGMTRVEYDDALSSADEVTGYRVRAPDFDAIERGGIVGVTDLVDVLTPKGQRYGWHMHGQFGFVLRNVRPLPFLPCWGALGFWGNFELRDGKAVQL